MFLQVSELHGSRRQSVFAVRWSDESVCSIERILLSHAAENGRRFQLRTIVSEGREFVLIPSADRTGRIAEFIADHAVEDEGESMIRIL